MLGSLNKWLRICGYETKYVKNAPDEELLTMAGEKDLTLLTKDRNLFRKARRAGVKTFLVKGEGDAESLALLSRGLGVKLDPKMARCTVCGGTLSSVKKVEVECEVPETSFDAYERFWKCDGCGKVYWRGSHWRKIMEKIDMASRLSDRS
jgi:hypothetical protein